MNNLNLNSDNLIINSDNYNSDDNFNSNDNSNDNANDNDDEKKINLIFNYKGKKEVIFLGENSFVGDGLKAF